MKLAYGSVPVKALNINYFEQDTNDCDMIASDLQAGKTAVARGKKIVGTGKSFEFAMYGSALSNAVIPLPNVINAIQVASVAYPIQQTMTFDIVRGVDFATEQVIGYIIKDGVNHPINIQINNNILMLTCDLTIDIQLFFGKDNYV